jgi:hypothetical protein
MPRKKKSNVYFTKETENAIVLYNSTADEVKKSQIYQDKIHYAFFKLTENIIHTYKFYYTETDNIEDLQHEIIVFLLSKIHLYDQTKGTKAYSYFGTIVKRWLILNNNKNYKTQQNRTELEPLQEDINHSYELDKGSYVEKLSEFTEQYIKYCSDNIYALFPNKNDAQIADAILELFRKRDGIEVFNKKALYIYIREIVDAKTIKITKISNILRKIYKDSYIFYLENGYIKFS